MPLIDRADSLLVVVDTQPRFYAHPTHTEDERAEATATLHRIVWLAGIARRLDIPAVVVVEGPERNGATAAPLLERLQPDVPTFTKPTFGLAEQPEIVDAVRATQRGTVGLVGFETDVCVAQSAIGLLELGFRAVVPEDAVYSTGELQHRRGLARMSDAGVERSHCKGLVYEWLREVESGLELLRADAAEHGEPPVRL